jgi:hypothetical protein
LEDPAASCELIMKIQNSKSLTRENTIRNPASRTAKYPHESRVGWTIAYPDRRNGFCGVVRLSQTGKRYWINIREHQDCSGFDLQLKTKDEPGAKPYRCCIQASAIDPDQFAGPLQLADVGYQISLWKDAGALRVHFTLEGGVE